MPRGQKFGGRDFPVGHPGGPGRPPVLPELKNTPRFSRDDFNRMATQILFSNRARLAEILAKPDSNNLEIAIAKVVDKIQVHGDYNRLDGLLNRLIGTVKHDINLTGELSVEGPPVNLIQIAVQMSSHARQLPAAHIDSLGEGSPPTH